VIVLLQNFDNKNNLENRLIFDKVIGIKTLCHFWPTLYVRPSVCWEICLRAPSQGDLGPSMNPWPYPCSELKQPANHCIAAAAITAQCSTHMAAATWHSLGSVCSSHAQSSKTLKTQTSLYLSLSLWLFLSLSFVRSNNIAAVRRTGLRRTCVLRLGCSALQYDWINQKKIAIKQEFSQVPIRNKTQHNFELSSVGVVAVGVTWP